MVICMTLYVYIYIYAYSLIFLFQLDFAFQNGLEAVRILLLEGFNKSATFMNTTKHMEQLG